MQATRLFFNCYRALEQLPYRDYLNQKELGRFCSSDAIPPGTIITPTRPITIDNMQKSDLKIAFDWAKQERWNPDLHEIEAFYAADPRGYWMLWLDGQPIASLALVKYSECYAFMGLYIVIPEFRGQGYGKLLWDAAMGTVTPSSTVALNGVMDQVKTYEQSGFEVSHLNTRWKTNLFNSRANDSNDSYRASNLKPTLEVASHEVAALDKKISSAYRPHFWDTVLCKPGSYFVASKDNEGSLDGFGVLSTCVDGYKLGPVYARDVTMAEDLVLHLWKYAQSISMKSDNPDISIQLDTTELNSHARAFAERLGFQRVFDTARMYKGPEPEMPRASWTFGMTSLEIG